MSGIMKGSHTLGEADRVSECDSLVERADQGSGVTPKNHRAA